MTESDNRRRQFGYTTKLSSHDCRQTLVTLVIEPRNTRGLLSMIDLKPVGVVHTPLSNEEVKATWPGGPPAEIHIFPDYAEALDGIDGFTHLIVISYLHEVTAEQRKTLKVRPKRMARYGLKLEDLPLVGVFCLDSPHRPNPIGLSIVRLLGRDGNILKVEGLDVFDQTPVLDIKPYTSARCINNVQVPEWLKSLPKRP